MIMQVDALQYTLSSNISQRVHGKVGSDWLQKSTLTCQGLGTESSEKGPRSGSDTVAFLCNLGERKSDKVRL